MRGPAYHLRPNKGVDRLIFMDAIRILGRLTPLRTCTYHGFGGPFLEDFRLVYESNPDIGMVSIERDPEVLKRQRFHKPCASIRLEHTDLSSFIATFDPGDDAGIFWLDYTGLAYSNFDELTALLTKVPANSLVKVTLRARWNDFLNDPDSFNQKFGALMPDPQAPPPTNQKDFASLLQSMLQIVAQRALPAASGMTFQPICTFYYSDGTPMFTASGIVCERKQRDVVRQTYRDWSFASLNWAQPKRIDVPTLTTKERLSLQELLPRRRRSGSVLRRALGYLIDDNKPKTEATLRQYAIFHRYYPYIMRAVP